MKDLSKMITQFEKLHFKSDEMTRPKNEPNYSYFYLARQIAKCMIKADALNLHVYPVRMEINGTKQFLI